MALCAVSGTIVSAGGTPLANTRVAFYGAVPTYTGTLLVDDALASALTDANGMFTISLVQGAAVRLRCIALGHEDTPLIVPNSATTDLTTMLANAGAEPPDGTTFATEAQLSAVADRVTTIEGAGYQTAAQVTTIVNAAVPPVVASAVSSALANYSTTSQMNAAIASALAGYVTASSLATTLGGYVTTSTLTTTLGSYVTNGALTTALSSYVTSSSLATTLGAYATTTAMNAAIAAALASYTVTFAQVRTALATANQSVGFNGQIINGLGGAVLGGTSAIEFSGRGFLAFPGSDLAEVRNTGNTAPARLRISGIEFGDPNSLTTLARLIVSSGVADTIIATNADSSAYALLKSLAITLNEDAKLSRTAPGVVNVTDQNGGNGALTAYRIQASDQLRVGPSNHGFLDESINSLEVQLNGGGARWAFQNINRGGALYHFALWNNSALAFSSGGDPETVIRQVAAGQLTMRDASNNLAQLEVGRVIGLENEAPVYVAGTSTTIAAGQSYTVVGTTTAAFTATLPDLSAVVDGDTYRIKDGVGTAATRSVTLRGSGTELIDSANTAVINTNWGGLAVRAVTVNSVRKWLILNEQLLQVIPGAASSTPVASSGNGAVGAGTAYARDNHVHPPHSPVTSVTTTGSLTNTSFGRRIRNTGAAASVTTTLPSVVAGDLTAGNPSIKFLKTVNQPWVLQLPAGVTCNYNGTTGTAGGTITIGGTTGTNFEIEWDTTTTCYIVSGFGSITVS